MGCWLGRLDLRRADGGLFMRFTFFKVFGIVLLKSWLKD